MKYQVEVKYGANSNLLVDLSKEGIIEKVTMDCELVPEGFIEMDWNILTDSCRNYINYEVSEYLRSIGYYG